MKQQLPTSDHKATTSSPSPSPAPAPATRRAKNNTPRTESANGVSPVSKSRPKPVPTEPSHTMKRATTTTRSTPLSKLKPGGDHVDTPTERETEDSKISGRPGNRAVEQYARLRRRPDVGCKGSEDRTVKELQSEVSGLKAQLESLQSLNDELESQNKHLVENLLAAEAKISELERREQAASISKEAQPSEFSNARKLIANKLDHIRIKKEFVGEDINAKMHTLELQGSLMRPFPSPLVRPAPVAEAPPPPPPPPPAPVAGAPPPPPPPPPAPARANTKQKASAIVELYHSLSKRDGTKDPSGSGNRGSPVANSAHNSIVGELQNRSAHLLAIKADVETKGDFIRHLIERVQSAAYTDIEDVLAFVDWLDRELSTLADERAVLKHFNWPERKADALREAAFEYRDLKRLEVEVCSFQDDACLPCEATLKKIESLLDRLERSIHRLSKLRDSTAMLSYRESKIPTDWMLDSGVVRKMKLASVKLARVCMKRVSAERELLRHSERESLLFQGVRFAYRAHQFAGGLDPETMNAFEELRARVQAHGNSSRELIPVL